MLTTWCPFRPTVWKFSTYDRDGENFWGREPKWQKNFCKTLLACGGLSLLAPYLRLFQRRLSAPGRRPAGQSIILDLSKCTVNSVHTAWWCTVWTHTAWSKYSLGLRPAWHISHWQCQPPTRVFVLLVYSEYETLAESQEKYLLCLIRKCKFKFITNDTRYSSSLDIHWS